jgi:hypothetical protein
MWMDGTTYRFRSEADCSAGLIKEEYKTQVGRTEAPQSPVARTVELVKPLHASGRHPTNHAYLDRLTVPSDSIVWWPERQPRVTITRGDLTSPGWVSFVARSRLSRAALKRDVPNSPGGWGSDRVVGNHQALCK